MAVRANAAFTGAGGAVGIPSKPPPDLQRISGAVISV